MYGIFLGRPSTYYVKKNKKKLCGSRPRRFGLECLICIEQEKVREDVADYESELKISECVCVTFEFRILILNFEF